MQTTLRVDSFCFALLAVNFSKFVKSKSFVSKESLFRNVCGIKSCLSLLKLTLISSGTRFTEDLKPNFS